MNSGYRTLEESHELFYKMKNYFFKNRYCEIIIAISNRPMCQWKVYPAHEEEKARAVRLRLQKYNFDYARFIYSDGHCKFFYADKNMIKLQDVDTGTVLRYERVPSFDFELMTLELQKLIQGE